MLNDPLAAALTKLLNAERVGQREVFLKPASRLLQRILLLLQEHHYVGSCEQILEHGGLMLKLQLLGNINKCGVVKPRFSTKQTTYEKWEKRYLPAKDFGIILVSTPRGVMTHHQAKEQHLGGKLIAYCY